MDFDFVTLSLIALVASILQSATGVGFGVIAGPALLVVLNSHAAVQVSILLNLLIALTLVPALWKDVDWSLIRILSLGLVVGSPVGVYVYQGSDITWLKVFAALAVLISLFLVIRRESLESAPGTASGSAAERITVATVGGIMGSSLAMPGPVPAAWMVVRHYDRRTVRATILCMFVVAYSLALVLQYFLVGIETGVLRMSGSLVPATILGIVVGHVLSSRVSPTLFRRALAVVLFLSVIGLLGSLVPV